MAAHKANTKWSDEDVSMMVAKLQELSDDNTCDNGSKSAIWQAVADMLKDDLKNRSACEPKFMRLKGEYK